MSLKPAFASAAPAPRLRWPRAQYATTGLPAREAISPTRLSSSDSGMCTACGSLPPSISLGSRTSSTSASRFMSCVATCVPTSFIGDMRRETSGHTSIAPETTATATSGHSFCTKSMGVMGRMIATMTLPATATASSMTPRPVVLLILDGFGSRPDAPDNAITRARMPNWNALLAHYAHGTIDASEMHVGLPDGQMGNSEVGHLNIGAGRVVYQDLTRIDHAIATGEFASNRVLNDALALARANGRAVHLLGLLSPGGVHSHQAHI